MQSKILGVNTPKQRNIGIDFLRIVLMLMIIMAHLFTHTNIRQELLILSSRGIWCWGTQTICLCAVNCFVLITGYFMYYAKWQLNHLLKLWLTIFIYSIGIGAIFMIVGYSHLSVSTLLNMFFPVLRRVWWFMSMYILLYLFIPFLNKGLRALTSKQFSVLVVGITIVFYVLPLFGLFFPPYDVSEGMGIIGFITLYIIGAYVSKQKFSLSWRWCLCGLLLNNLIIFFSKVGLTYIVETYHLGGGTGLLYHYNSIFELVNAILLLLLFKQFSFASLQGSISVPASSVFAVYLIHEHPLVRHWLWQTGLFSVLGDASFGQFVILSLVIPLGVFLSGVLIDKIIHVLIINPIFKTTFWQRICIHSQKINNLFKEDA